MMQRICHCQKKEKTGSVHFKQLITEVVLSWIEVKAWDVKKFLSWVLKTSLFRQWSFQSTSLKKSAIWTYVVLIWYKYIYAFITWKYSDKDFPDAPNALDLT